MAIDVTTQFADQLGHGVDIATAAARRERGLSLGHQACGHDRQRGVLAAADFDFAFEAMPAVNRKLSISARPWAGKTVGARLFLKARNVPVKKCPLPPVKPFGLSATPLADDQYQYWPRNQSRLSA